MSAQGEMAAAARVEGAPAGSRQLHPRGLRTLFFTEMWERLSYYGMRALLVLFMVDQVKRGGLGLTDKTAAAIYGLYTAGVYMAALPGGWIADRLIGGQRAVLAGGCLIAMGHFTLAVPRAETFFLGLVLIVIGTGLLKPNVSALVGRLYPEGGARRDAGFTIFYMGINLGAFLGPIVCSALGEKINWHVGFAAAGVGMVLGLIQFTVSRRHLGDIGGRPEGEATRRRDWKLVIGAGIFFAFVGVLVLMRIIVVDPVLLATYVAYFIASLAILYFAGVFLFGRLDAQERQRMMVVVILFVSSALFWAGYEQAGSSLNLFGDRYTVRTVPAVLADWVYNRARVPAMCRSPMTVPTGWLQSIGPLFVILWAPVVAILWTFLAKRGRVPSLPVKFGWGLGLLSIGFLIVSVASQRALRSGPVWPGWLIATYLFHVWGELFISPVGLSSVTKLAPARLVGQVMGLWFLATSFGNLLAGLFAGEVSGAQSASMPAGFLYVALFAAAIGAMLLVFARPIRRLMAGIE